MQNIPFHCLIYCAYVIFLFCLCTKSLKHSSMPKAEYNQDAHKMHVKAVRSWMTNIFTYYFFCNQNFKRLHSCFIRDLIYNPNWKAQIIWLLWIGSVSHTNRSQVTNMHDAMDKIGVRNYCECGQFKVDILLCEYSTYNLIWMECVYIYITICWCLLEWRLMISTKLCD